MTRLIPERTESARRFLTGVAAVTRVIRARDELSQTEVARRAGVSARFVSDIECEQANPTFVRLDKLACGLGLAGVTELAALADETADRIATSTTHPTN